MATVKAIKYGMKGDDVANLQTALKNAGYNIDVDGSFGPQTLAAVKSYQQANGLDVDGMVGPQTTAALYGSGSKTSYSNTSPSAMSGADAGSPAVVPSNSTPTTATSRPASSSSLPTPTPPTQDAGTNSVLTDDGMKVVVPEGSTAPATNTSIPTQSNPNAGSLNTDVEATPAVVPNSTPGAGSASPTGVQIIYPDDYTPGTFDQNESETVQQANAALQAILAAQPGAYQSQWQSQINDIINRILNREEFSYDVNEDALYQQYKDQYIQGGKLAMQDTMGQAAAMTGGYGNSYAATVGNQAYQAYLSKLYEVVPELYGMALDRYKMEGEELYNQYGLLSSEDQKEYGRWQDTYNQWLADRDYYTGRYDTEYDKYYTEWSDAEDRKWADYVNSVNMSQFNANFYQGQKEHNDTMEFNTSSQEREYAYKTAMELLINGEMPSADLLAAAGISEADATAMINAAKASKLEGNASEDRKYAYQTVMEMLSYGQMPSAELLAAAGISEADAKALMSAYQNAAISSSSGSGKVSGSVTGETETSKLTDTKKIEEWKSLILNAETLEEVEEYCDSLAEIDEGKAFLYYEMWLKAHGMMLDGSGTVVPIKAAGAVTSSHGTNSQRPNVMQ